MNTFDYLKTLCLKSIIDKNLNNTEYKKRLKEELYEIFTQEESEYFIKLYKEKVKFEINENNLLVPFLLDLCPEPDMNISYKVINGEFPDIDVDYLPKIRDYIKNDWAPKKFGKDKVCSISTYGTLKIKMALLDVARIYGLERDKVLSVTKQLKTKDDDGKELSWDKAIELYPEMAEFCQTYPEIAESAKMLLNRHRSKGIHAGGLIISNKSIDAFVPLEVRKEDIKNDKEGIICSSWTEGQSSQDLQPVGLIKFDMLVVDGLNQIKTACELIRDRYGISNICSGTNGRNWTDESYLNDPNILKTADNCDMVGIFQFGSEGMQSLVRKCKIDKFEDIPALSSLYRPGPMLMGMHHAYINRKNGTESYSLHPLIKPILESTYGILVYQEQVMQILHAVGDIPLIHCEKLRKAISKKKDEIFGKYKNLFIDRGMYKLGMDKKYLEDLWSQIEAFAGYGFNKSHAYAYSLISMRQLWLKTYYPIEFFTSLLICEEHHDKIKEYINDAKKHNIDVHSLDLNKSKEDFSIVDNSIYYGFSKIKGLGKDVSSQLVKNQPYENFQDFVNKNKAEETVIKPLIALGLFCSEYEDKLYNYNVYKNYKRYEKTLKDRKISLEKKLNKITEELNEILSKLNLNKDTYNKCNQFNISAYAEWHKLFKDTIIKISKTNKKTDSNKLKAVNLLDYLNDIKNKREDSIKSVNNVPALIEKNFIKEMSKKSDIEYLEILNSDVKVAEKKFYGFPWKHELEELEEYEGCTLDKFNYLVEFENVRAAPVEVKLLELRCKPFKNGRGRSWDLIVEDSYGKSFSIKMWDNDYETFKDYLQVDNLLKIRITPQVEPFPFYNLESYGNKWIKLPKRDIKDDCRIILLKGKK